LIKPETLHTMKIRRATQKGVMLLEALIGILIFSIGILALIAMQSVAISQMRDAQYRTEASTLANRMMGELVLLRTTASPEYAATYARWQSDVATLPGGSGTVTQTVNPLGALINDVRINITWRAPGSSADSNHVVFGTLSYNTTP
jgi:type IV pilus assembly protein PilV